MTRLGKYFQKITIQFVQKCEFHSKNRESFGKILIANRGEIACRIIKSAKKLGIKTVAVYSTADARERHTKLADERVYLGPSPAKQSYLNQEKILKAIKESNAEAVHPGYGFLSENPNFVEMLENEEITFIGPSSKIIRLMGDKIESKKIAREAGINTIPGFDGVVKNEEDCLAVAKEIDYPVIIKASAGGGGKAMRIARNANDIRKGFKLSMQEARSSFGDNRMLVEKFIENPRHIEIQILGDKYGNCIHLNERECSIQRRNQKVIEEAPSTFLTQSMREKIGKQAVSLCQKLGYSSAGTVEFLVDQNHQFYFLEMNTRLQVEHPVTELITGIDLVEQMIKIAKGYRLEIQQNDVKINGWSIESRIYAEDCYKNFGLPSTGRLFKYIEPVDVRCDSGVEEGTEISIHYDPLISKLICHGINREDAIKQSIQSLDSYVIRGVSHNIPLLRDIFTEKSFNAGNLSTNYLFETYPQAFKGLKLDAKSKQNLLSIAAALYFLNEQRNRQFLTEPKSVKPTKNSIQIVISLNDDKACDVTVEDNSIDYLTIKLINDNRISKISKKDLNFSDPLLKTWIDGATEIFQLISKNAIGEFQLIYRGTCYKLNIVSKQAANLLYLMPSKPKLNATKLIKTAMPGLVRNIYCRIGDEVIEGQELCTIEAMKMQNSMRAPTKAKIKSILIQKNCTVAKDDILIELE